MQIHYPQALVDRVRRATTGRKLTGEYVPGEGPVPAKLALIGEAPGRTEIATGHPFVGAAGKELDRNLALASLTRPEIFITSVVRARPYSRPKAKATAPVTALPNRTPTKKEVAAFAPLFDWELAAIGAPVLVVMGNTALQRLLGPTATIGTLHGQVLHQPVLEWRAGKYCPGNKSYWLVPMYHPAATLYARKLTPTVEADWRALGEWLKKHPLADT